MVGNLDITDGTGRTVALTEEVQGDDVEEDNATVRGRPFRNWTEYKLSVLRDDDLPAKHPRPSKAHLQYRSSASEPASQESHSQQPKPVSQTTAIYLRGHQGQGTTRKNLQSSKTTLRSYIASRHQAQALKFEMARRVSERHRHRFQRCLRSENRMHHEEIYRERSEASRRPILDRSRESRLANIVRRQGTVERQMARIRRQGSIETSRRDEQEHRQYNDQVSRRYTWKL